MDGSYWNDWKFHIHWSKLECVNTRSSDEQKNPFCVSSKENCFKDNVKPAHWVGPSQLRSPDSDDLFKRTPGVDAKQASVTGNKTKQSVPGKK